MPKFKTYDDRIAHLHKVSDYHFDPFRADQPLNIIGHFTGADWMPEVERLEQEAKRFGFGECCVNHKPGDVNYQFDLAATDEQNYSQEHVFVDRIGTPAINRKSAPILYQMVDWFELEAGTISPRLHIQRPGQVFPIHVDGLTSYRRNSAERADMYSHPDSWTRVQIQLKDWIWGHFWGVGNQVWAQWKAGEIMYHPWWIYPHGTANAGFSPRYSLQITGKTTEATREKLTRSKLTIPVVADPSS